MKKLKAKIKIEFEINEKDIRSIMRQLDYEDGEYDENDISDTLNSFPEEQLLEFSDQIPSLDVEVFEYDESWVLWIASKR